MDIKNWMSKKMLKLNDDKTEVLYITSPYFQKSLPNPTLKIDQSSITPTTSARNIGVIFDNSNQMKEHITTVCRASHFHLRNIGSIRRYLTPETCATLVHSLNFIQTGLLQFLTNRTPRNSDQSPSAHPKLCCTYCQSTGPS